MTVVDPHVKRLLLSLMADWNPACDECGKRHASVRAELYVVTTKKKGYTLKWTRHGCICTFCRDKFRFGDCQFIFMGIDPARGPDLSVGYVYAPYIPQALLGPGERQ